MILNRRLPRPPAQAAARSEVRRADSWARAPSGSALGGMVSRPVQTDSCLLPRLSPFSVQTRLSFLCLQSFAPRLWVGLPVFPLRSQFSPTTASRQTRVVRACSRPAPRPHHPGGGPVPGNQRGPGTHRRAACPGPGTTGGKPWCRTCGRTGPAGPRRRSGSTRPPTPSSPRPWLCAVCSSSWPSCPSPPRTATWRSRRERQRHAAAGGSGNDLGIQTSLQTLQQQKSRKLHSGSKDRAAPTGPLATPGPTPLTRGERWTQAEQARGPRSPALLTEKWAKGNGCLWRGSQWRRDSEQQTP